MEELLKFLEELAAQVSENHAKVKDDVLRTEGQFQAVQVIFNKAKELAEPADESSEDSAPPPSTTASAD